MRFETSVESSGRNGVGTNEMHGANNYVDPTDTEGNEAPKGAQEPKMELIESVHDHVIHDLKHSGKAFVDRFKKVFDMQDPPPPYKFEDGQELPWELVFEPRRQSRSILHQIIELVGDAAVDVKAAKSLVGMLVWDVPTLIGIRESATKDRFNALELAVDRKNCQEIIEAICESGMGSAPKKPDEKKAIDDDLSATNSMKERLKALKAELRFRTGEGISTDALLPAIPSKGGPGGTVTGHVQADGKNSVERNEGTNTVDEMKWEGLKEKLEDTCLHMAIRNKQHPTALYLLDKLALAIAEEQNSILTHIGRGGLRPLHIAVDFKECCEERIELVKRIIEICPEALCLPIGTISSGSLNTDDKEGLTPLKHFLSLKDKTDARDNVLVWTPPEGHKGLAKRMEDLLRLSCMRHHGYKRDIIMKLLDSKGQIHLDLNPRKELTQPLFEYMEKHMIFDSYLQYVFVPKLQVVGVTNKRLASEDWWSSLSPNDWWSSLSRKDYVYLFRWLKAVMKVERILSIVVEDDPTNYHSDEAIEEALKGFHIEGWNWIKPDLCIDTIHTAAENVRDLTLHWSGNRAILKSWAAPDGLAKLQNLEKIRIMTPVSIESATRTQAAINSFLEDLEKSWETLQMRPKGKREDEKEAGKERNAFKGVPTVEFETVTTQTQSVKQLSEKDKKEKSRKERWSRCTDDFARTVKQHMNTRIADKSDPLERKPEHSDLWINVAIIDDGVDPEKDDIGTNIECGETFYDNWGQWPGFYQSSYGHGHLMARHIRQLCPKVRLHIAKLNELWSDGKPQITAESAANAIKWAVEKKVDIISMSWSIEAPNEDAVKPLKDAIDLAVKADILLFCASNDQGRTGQDISYPAKFDVKIFTIGSATALGNADERTQKSVKYIAPGADDLGQVVHGEEPGSSKPVFGSSIATARCAGLAALILQSVMLVCFFRYPKSKIRNHENMKAMFDLMVDREHDKENNYLGVWSVLEVAKGRAEFVKIEEWTVIHTVAMAFCREMKWMNLSILPPLPPRLNNVVQPTRHDSILQNLNYAGGNGFMGRSRRGAKRNQGPEEVPDQTRGRGGSNYSTSSKVSVPSVFSR